MRPLYDNILQCIGDTPSVRLNRVTAGLAGDLYAKVEYINPANSVKDRMAVKIIDDLEKSGKLKPGGTIVEATSGNTGAGLAMTAAVRGYKTIFVMPDKQSEEKRAALRAYGAKVVICPTDVEPDDPRSYYKTAARLVEETPNAAYSNQYHNPSNPQAHYELTGPEIWEQFEGKLDVFISGLGTGGTISGIGKYLKEKDPKVRVVGVDPVGSLYFDYFHTGQLTQPYSYKVEGIGEDFLPSTMDFSFVDDVVRVNDKECFVMTRRLVREEGIFAGTSSGAAVAGAVKWMRLNGKDGMRALVLLPDSGARYLSKVYNDNWMRENGFLEPELGLGTVADMTEGRRRELVTARPDQRVTEVIGLLKLHGISQVPVVEDGKVLGILTENRLLERALTGGRGDIVVRDLVEATWCTVDETTEVAVLTELFKRSKVALVVAGQKPVDIITRIDLIDYIARVTGAHRDRQ
ncbi:MAG: cystathionine beta-synthase [Myxococcota bacterium]